MERQPDRVAPSGRRQIVLEHEWREAFVGEALTLEVDSASVLVRAELYSAAAGVVCWVAGPGMGKPHRWEAEAECEAVGGTSRIFKALLLDGGSANDAGAIAADVLAALGGSPLGDWLRAALLTPAEPHVLDEALLPLPATPAYAAADAPLPHRGLGQRVLDLMRPYTAWSRRSPS